MQAETMMTSISPPPPKNVKDNPLKATYQDIQAYPCEYKDGVPESCKSFVFDENPKLP